WPAETDTRESLLLVLSLMAAPYRACIRRLMSTMLAQHLLDVFDIVGRELSGLHKPRHYRLHLAAKQTQQIINQTSLRLVSRNRRFKYLRFADSLHQTESLLVFEAIDGGLHRRISRPRSFGKRFLDLADGTRAALPEGFHDLQFEPGQFGQLHAISYV